MCDVFRFFKPNVGKNVILSLTLRSWEILWRAEAPANSAYSNRNDFGQKKTYSVKKGVENSISVSVKRIKMNEEIENQIFKCG